MDVKDLRCVIAVYEAGGFARAAKSLETVQSNVSARIRKLEASLGATLFHRRYRTVTPTQKGRRLYAHAQRVIAMLDESERDIRDQRVA